MEILAWPSNSWTTRRSAPQARTGGCPLDRGPRLLACETPATIAQEERAAAIQRDVVERQEAGSRAVRPAHEPVHRNLAHRHEPFLVALADDTNECAITRQVLAVKPDRLTDPKSGRVQQLEQRPVAQASRSRRFLVAGGLEEALRLGNGEGLRQQARRFGQVEVESHVNPDQALAVGKSVEALQRGGSAPEAARREARVMGSAATGPGREVAHRRIRGSTPTAPDASRVGEVGEVRPVGADRGRRQATLDLEVGEVLVDRAPEVGHDARIIRPGRHRCAMTRHDRAALVRWRELSDHRPRHPASGPVRRSGPRDRAARSRSRSGRRARVS